MSIVLGTTQINKKVLGVNSLNKIMLGVIQLFPSLAPSAWSPLDLPNLLAWYDPSDLSTMFQDLNNQNPITTSGQPVGLILDKSGTLGTPVVSGEWTNAAPTFDFDTFTPDGSGGFTAVKSTAGGTDVAVSTNTIPLVVGEWWLIEAVVTVNTLSGCSLRIGSGTNSRVQNTNFVGTGTIRRYVQINSASGVNGTLSIATGSIGTITIESMTMRRALGNHLSQATAASRPQYLFEGGAHWLVGDGVDDVLFGTLAPELLPPWEMWVAAQMDTGGGINTGLFSVAPSASGGSTGVRTSGLFQRTDGTQRQLTVNVRVGGNTVNGVGISNTFDLNQAFVMRGVAGVLPDTIFVEEGADSNSAVATYGAATGDNAFRLFQASVSGQLRVGQAVSISAQLSAGDATQLQQYMDAKTGITP